MIGAYKAFAAFFMRYAGDQFKNVPTEGVDSSGFLCSLHSRYNGGYQVQLRSPGPGRYVQFARKTLLASGLSPPFLPYPQCSLSDRLKIFDLHASIY